MSDMIVIESTQPQVLIEPRTGVLIVVAGQQIPVGLVGSAGVIEVWSQAEEDALPVGSILVRMDLMGATTTAAPTTTTAAPAVPPAPGQPSAAAVSTTQIEVSWPWVNAALSGYKIYYSTSANLTKATRDGSNPYPAEPNATAGIVSFGGNWAGTIATGIALLNPGTTYYFKVTSVSQNGQESTLSSVVSATTAVTTTAAPAVPPVPDQPTAAAISATGINVMWPWVNAALSGYRIYYSTSGNLTKTTRDGSNPYPNEPDWVAGIVDYDGNAVGTITATIPLLNPGTTYYFKITSVSQDGQESALSSVASATTTAATTTAAPTTTTAAPTTTTAAPTTTTTTTAAPVVPSAPGQPSAAAVSTTQINVSWPWVNDALSGYKIYYSTSTNLTKATRDGSNPYPTEPNGTAGIITYNGNSAGTITTAIPLLNPGTTYYFKITSVSQEGQESALSLITSATTNATTTAAPTTTTTTAAPTTTTTTAAPQPPTQPVITATGGDTTVTIAKTSGGTGATSYDLKWGTFAGSRANTITGVTLPYTHTGRTNGTTYYYSLVATNGQGSTESVEISAAAGVPEVVTETFETVTTGALPKVGIAGTWSGNGAITTAEKYAGTKSLSITANDGTSTVSINRGNQPAGTLSFRVKPILGDGSGGVEVRVNGQGVSAAVGSVTGQWNLFSNLSYGASSSQLLEIILNESNVADLTYCFDDITWTPS